MLTGTKFGKYEIGQKLGQGGYGEIFMVKNTKDHKIYALKTEYKKSRKNTLEFESKLMRTLSKYPNFPQFIEFGKNRQWSWLCMELLGPSLSSVIKQLPGKCLSLRCSFVVGLKVLEALQIFHDCGFIHRDIKPSNVLLRRDFSYPVVLIDYGLSRIYINEKTGEQLPARPHPGFRGTTVYASPNAHMHQDLSRRDDMISWFYLLLDILTGKLPWKKMTSKTDILHAKRRLNIEEICAPIAPELITIWNTMSNMAFTDRPQYEKIAKLMNDVINRTGSKKTYDWHPYIFDMKENPQDIFGGYEEVDHKLHTKIRRDSKDNNQKYVEIPDDRINKEDNGCCCCKI